jgi:hypothetical protein
LHKGYDRIEIAADRRAERGPGHIPPAVVENRLSMLPSK